MYSNSFEAQTIIGEFLEFFDTTKKLKEAYRLLNNPELEYRNLGCNNHSIKYEIDHIEFDYHLDTTNFRFGELYPFKLTITDFKRFISNASAFITKYEERKIPGLVPREDFENWSIVPNANIDANYLQSKINDNKVLFNELGAFEDIQNLLKLLDRFPQLRNDLLKHNSMTEGNAVMVKGLQMALYQTLKHQSYHGNIYGVMYSKIIDYKIKEFNLPQSIRSTIGDKVNHRNFELNKLDELLTVWTSKLNDDKLIYRLIEEIELINYKEEIKDSIKKYPNLLIELEELLANHSEDLSRKMLREIILEKSNSINESENLWGYLRGRLIKYLINKYNIPDENWVASEELRQWSFKNKWGLTELENYVKTEMRKSH